MFKLQALFVFIQVYINIFHHKCSTGYSFVVFFMIVRRITANKSMPFKKKLNKKKEKIS